MNPGLCTLQRRLGDHVEVDAGHGGVARVRVPEVVEAVGPDPGRLARLLERAVGGKARRHPVEDPSGLVQRPGNPLQRLERLGEQRDDPELPALPLHRDHAVPDVRPAEGDELGLPKPCRHRELVERGVSAGRGEELLELRRYVCSWPILVPILPRPLDAAEWVLGEVV
jgi:hypothetical protein